MDGQLNKIVERPTTVSLGTVLRVKPRRLETLAAMFEEQVDLNPEAIAIEGEGLSLSYQELDTRANQLAHLLRSFDVGPGQFVGLYYERSHEPIISILACLKAGAAYVPIDPIHPSDRIRHIVEEAQIELLLTERELSQKARSFFDNRILATDLLKDEIQMQSTRRLMPEVIGSSASDLAYVIYTSGTTGRPKGVMAENGHAYRYARAFNQVCDTYPDDRIYQGFSLGFDGSVEEIWMAFSNGATLVVPTRTTPKFGNELAEYLIQHRVTYFSTVPTALSTISVEIPELTQIVLSGEVCRPELVEQWATPSCKLYNVYGPTEATVNTTSVECVPGAPITIGRPLPGYEIHVLDESFQPVDHGVKGELYISGDTLARGYLKRDDLTSQKFVTIELNNKPTRVYRTGDLVRWNENDEIEFFGRIDGQVKIRGYRVELSEIEAVLLESPPIRSAVVGLVEKDGFKVLAAFVVLRSKKEVLCRTSVLELLKKRLPDYMVPSFLDELAEFPTLASGKVNRSLLPDPKCPLVRSDKKLLTPQNETEADLLNVWESVLGIEKISTDDDFFADLGGYSLLAAQLVTRLRAELEVEIAIRDIYQAKTIRDQAKILDERKKPIQQKESEPTSSQVFHTVTFWERMMVVSLQALSIFSFFLVGTLPFSVVVYVANSMYAGDMHIGLGIVLISLMGAVTWPIVMGFAVLSKWALLGKVRPGVYPVWGLYYFRWWLVQRFQSITGVGFFAGTPLMSLWYRLMGAKVGKGTFIQSAHCSAWDLVQIGDETTIGPDTQLPGYRIESGQLKIGSVSLGNRCYVGGHSALGINVKMADDSSLGDQSYLPDGQMIEAGISMSGSPAVNAQVYKPESGSTRFAWTQPVKWSLIFLCVANIGWFMSVAVALFYLGLLALAFSYGGIIGGVLWIFGGVPLVFVTYCFYVGLVRKIVMPRARTGVFQIQSMDYLRRWFMDGMMRANREILKPLYTTIFFPAWLRLLGAKIDRFAEISTLWYCSPELLDIGESSFFADGCIVGGTRAYRGYVEVQKNKIGQRSFVGNGAHVPAGQSIGDNCLIGVLSSPPADQGSVQDGTEWLGHPSFKLPHRPKITHFNLEETFKPSRRLIIERSFIDALRILIPLYIGTVAITLELAALVVLFLKFGTWTMVAASPVVSFLLAMFVIGSVVGLKWVVMGGFKPVIKPLWCRWVWLNEMVNGAYESVMTPTISMFLGTPFVAVFLRMIGVKVGKHTYIASVLFSEFDLIEIGDYSTLAAGSVLQTHLFEDRVFKSSYVKLDEGATVGNMSIVLYDTQMKQNSKLRSLSLLMKGETLAEATCWQGIPTVQIQN